MQENCPISWNIFWAGKNSDIENLKYVVHRLLLIREVSNVTYLFSDGCKMAEAAAMASASLLRQQVFPY